MLTRPPTAYDDKIYYADWRAYVDPAMPETIAPTALLIDRHLGTAIEHKAALLVDGVPVSYGELAERVAAVSAGLAAHGVVREDRILLFGTDSLDYVTMWFGAHRRDPGRRLRSLQGAGPPLFPVRHRGALSLHRCRAAAEACADRRRPAAFAGDDFRAGWGRKPARTCGPLRHALR
jgi:hypothetical protein